MIDTERIDAITVITIDRPEKKNALTYAMLSDLRAATDEAIADDAVNAIVLRGVPGSFCSGIDLADLAGRPSDDRTDVRDTGRFTHGWWAFADCPKPVVAAVDGAAVGLGAEYTIQCDVRIATPAAKFAWNFGHRGLIPDTGAGTWLLPRLVGLQEAARMMLSGEFIDAERALAVGLVQRVVDSDALLDVAVREATRLSSGSPLSTRLVKSLMYQGLGRSADEHLDAHREALGRCFASADHHEGIAAFFERRPPKFTGQ